MSPADLLLDHFDRIAKRQATFARASPEGDGAPINLAIYRGFPSDGAFTAFTVGLSHCHPPGGSHQELTISMQDDDDIWALAMGVVAHRLREQSAFNCGDTINFGEAISGGSSMSAFVVSHPTLISAAECEIDIGVRKIRLVELIPIFQQEREWLAKGGSLQRMLNDRPRALLMNPNRTLLIPPNTR
ncbi:MAG TPA: suppressor of fused domain protein [Usitatibacter sp.]|nr:suppressor of fused domain protein [Usitatibacter sp.]